MAAAQQAIAVEWELALCLASAVAASRRAIPYAQPGTGAIVGQLLLASFLRPLLPLAFMCRQ
jgi:hypothetical protein